MTVMQTDAAIECESADAKWSYALDGADRQSQFGVQTWSSVAKWEGSALLINTLVSPASYTVMDRWELSRNRALLVLTRQVVHGTIQSEGQFYYRREGAAVLQRRPEVAAGDQDYVVKSGSRILLELVNQLDTRHSQDGDRVYLRVAFPVYANNKLVIPQGATVLGTVTEVKKPGKTSGKGELYIRFDSLTLPNGVTRDFRSRLGSANGAQGTVDRDEGKVTSPSDKAEKTSAAVHGAGMGAAIGAIAGGAAGHPITGLGVGGAAGAAAGLATVMAKGRPPAVLPKGTNVEMILDRDLHYTRDELR
jgi:hypothetical protein